MPTLEAVQAKVRSRIPEIPPLKWKKLNDYALVSDCNQFYIGKAIVMGITQYDCWYKAQGGGAAIQLRMNLPTADDAKAWLSAIANAYRKGELSLRTPLTVAETQRLKAADSGDGKHG
jgi:hypothetical protein